MLVGSLLLAIVFSLQLSAQRTSGNISGVVSDPSGAVVPNAKVTATEISTQTATNAATNESGFYVLTGLQPGTYRLNVAATGFQKYERTSIALQVGGDLTVNVSLVLGSSTEKITVTGEADLVNTRDSTVSSSITPQFTEQLPLNGRNIMDLMALAPDTSVHVGAALALQSATRPDSASGFVTASGAARENSTAFYLNGGLDMDSYTQVANVFPNPDAVQEFTFDTNSYNAKYGGLGGGVVNAVTRGGTNQFHGSAFEYLRNGDMNARNFFSSEPDTLKRNQFGGSLGAPIQKDKTFAFFSFQRTTYRYGTTANIAYGPTAAEMQGNWNDTGIVYDTLAGTNPITGRPQYTPNGTPFPGSLVPLSLYQPIALKILSLVPMGDPLTGRLTYMHNTLDNDNQFVGRIDRNFGDKLRIYGSVLSDTYANPAIIDPNNALTAAESKRWPSTHAALNATYTFGPNLVTTLGASLSRVLIHDTGTHAFPTTIQEGANIPNWLPTGQAETGGFYGWYDWGVDDHYFINRNMYDLTNTWTYMHGNHMLEFGAEYTQSQSVLNQDFWGNGWVYCCDGHASPNGGLDFLLGQAGGYEQNGPNIYDDLVGKSPSLYVNDKWRVSPRLTLNLGLRWEPWLPWTDNSAAHIGTYFDAAAFAAGTHSTLFPNLPPGLLVHGDPGVPNGLAPNDWKMFDPRVGLAWDVSGNGKTSIRAGFGIYHDQPFGYMYNAISKTPFVGSIYFDDPTVPWWSPYDASPYNGVLQQPPVGHNATFPEPYTTAYAFTPGFQPPATAQWNLTLEHQMGKGFLLRANYEASESWHMYDTRDLNAAVNMPGASDANTRQRRPLYPYYGNSIIADESTTTSSFNALNVSVEKRMTGNLSLLGGYRWSKCLDTNGGTNGVATFNFMEFSDASNTRLDRGLCNSDVASQLKMTAIYRLPSARSLGWVGHNVLGGWTISGILNWHDGNVYSIFGYQDSNLDGTNNQRAELVGNPNLPGGRSTAAELQEWFNTAAFTTPAWGSDANSPKNFLRGPGYFNLDCSLIKSIPIPYGPLKEAQKLDLRVEAFNALNHTNFGLPSANLGSSSFGQILSADDPRIMQVALKYIF